MKIIPSIFPSERGNLVIGPYPHTMTNEEARRLSDCFRQPFLVIEMKEEMIVRAAQPTFELVVEYMMTTENSPFLQKSLIPGRWVVFPVDYKGDTSMIYK